MPQIPADKAHFSFAGGINSEVSPLSFPDGVSLDEQNFEMFINGTRRRRRGLHLEDNHAAGDLSFEGTHGSDMASSTYRWTNVGGNPDRTFIVVQMGSVLYFAEESETLSTEFFSGFISLEDRGSTIDLASAREYPCVFASGRGYLFVSARYVDPFYVSFDPDTDTFTAHTLPIYVRDFRGVDDGTDIRTQPDSLTDDHRYNLVNRGWNANLITQ